MQEILNHHPVPTEALHLRSSSTSLVEQLRPLLSSFRLRLVFPPSPISMTESSFAPGQSSPLSFPPFSLAGLLELSGLQLDILFEFSSLCGQRFRRLLSAKTPTPQAEDPLSSVLLAWYAMYAALAARSGLTPSWTPRFSDSGRLRDLPVVEPILQSGHGVMTSDDVSELLPHLPLK